MQHLPSMFTLRDSLLRDLLHEKLHGSPGFVRTWPLPTAAPDRTTLWRWLNGKSQVPPGLVLALAGAFDLDPCALFDITPKAYAALCRALVRNMGTNRAHALTHDLQWLASFVVPSEMWPSDKISLQYFKRPWTVHSFRHTAVSVRNVFQKLSIAAAPRRYAEPQVWHFAFKNKTPTSLLWIPYGFVERTDRKLALFHYHARGHSVSLQIPRDTTEFLVETWLGPGPAEFRVASMHEFKFALSDKDDLATPCVRFP
jgi:hypothetical protein